MFIRTLFKYLQIWRGKAIDIWSKKPYPSNVLSNLYPNPFMFGGIKCGSMEGFLQSLKYADQVKQCEVCAMSGKEAKNMSVTDWQTEQVVYWKGECINRQSECFKALVKGAYEAMFAQNEKFRTALLSTKGMALFHCKGEKDPFKTILTECEFCSILTEIRDSWRYGEYPF